MAILKLGELVAGIRGTIGGTIYSQNKSGPFARAWSRGADPQSPAQTVQRAIMSTHGNYWLALSQSDRDDWDTYAADPDQELTNPLGEAYYATGFNWYCRINNHRLLSERTRRNTYPTCATPATPQVTGSFCYTPITVNFHNHIDHAANQFLDMDVIIHCTFTPRISPISKSRGYRGVHYTIRTTSAWTSFGLATLEKFGDPPSNGKCFYRIQAQHQQGRRSAVLTKTADIITL